MKSCSYQIQWLIDDSNDGMSIKEFLTNHKISKRALTDIKFSGGTILVNGREENVRYLLSTGEHLNVIFPPEIPSEQMMSEEIQLNILYEDDDLIVVDKPAGMNTIPSREHPHGSLANALIGYYDQQQLQRAPHIVTRLDRDTSGLVLIAKHRHVHHLLSEMQKKNEIKRVYEALAEGVFKETMGKIEQPIGRKTTSIIEREVREDGQYACTHYRVKQQFKDFALIQLHLKTGRTHQIRVHLSYIHHPLVGDDLYGGSTRLLSRQALHCSELRIVHPISGEKKVWKSPLPDDITQLID
ncbi:23S rRNA pseudouridine1911/1915/1917 synthase [Oikeobacillus pervagus]|uniref:Pseudouridine synthase n=1 Tax=Oikeobacillus pervagus TaxID=1325931 RepID=A0AAJ1T2L1_9BACI|nr:RluA family pseudouridine synthase [Oikeobacillus pervagus]MDQ0215647.1 23S rRNA pseudouridine1911/1915/1917 synthase [Oikeobacillus pervagus]